VILLGRVAKPFQHHPTASNIFDRSQTLPNITQQYPTSPNNIHHHPTMSNMGVQNSVAFIPSIVGICWAKMSGWFGQGLIITSTGFIARFHIGHSY